VRREVRSEHERRHSNQGYECARLETSEAGKGKYLTTGAGMVATSARVARGDDGPRNNMG